MPSDITLARLPSRPGDKTIEFASSSHVSVWVDNDDVNPDDAARLANLIGAAPDLLAALEHLMRYDFGDSDGAKEARAAIAKARGDQPRAKAMNAAPEPYKLGGVPLFDIAADIARTQARMITHEDRADGRVISPNPVRPNIHD